MTHELGTVILISFPPFEGLYGVIVEVLDDGARYKILVNQEVFFVDHESLQLHEDDQVEAVPDQPTHAPPFGISVEELEDYVDGFIWHAVEDYKRGADESAGYQDFESMSFSELIDMMREEIGRFAVGVAMLDIRLGRMQDALREFDV